MVTPSLQVVLLRSPTYGVGGRNKHLLCFFFQSIFFSTFLIFIRVADPFNADDTAQVTVTILDVNDNAPMFKNLPFALLLPEVRSIAVRKNYIPCYLLCIVHHCGDTNIQSLCRR